MKIKMSFSLADEIAGKLLKIFKPACERIEIAGSTRRRKSEIGDIEFVAVPKLASGRIVDLFGNAELVNLLDRRVYCFAAQDAIELIKDGPKYKKFLLKKESVGVDLFITTPPQWGYILSLRTGPSEFNERWNTQRNKGGLLPSQYRFEGGWLWCGDQRIDTPDEKEFFDLIGIGWIEPEQRSADALKNISIKI